MFQNLPKPSFPFQIVGLEKGLQHPHFIFEVFFIVQSQPNMTQVKWVLGLKKEGVIKLCDYFKLAHLPTSLKWHLCILEISLTCATQFCLKSATKRCVPHTILLFF